MTIANVIDNNYEILFHVLVIFTKARMAIAEYMREIRRDNKRLIDQLRKACTKADLNPEERYHQTQTGTLRWAIAIIEKLAENQFKPIQEGF